MQGQIWTETARTAEQLQEMVFPRLVALAERAWHKSHWEDVENKEERVRKTNEEWTSFAKALGHRELNRLEEMGITYHLPKPGARWLIHLSFESHRIGLQEWQKMIFI